MKPMSSKHQVEALIRKFDKDELVEYHEKIFGTKGSSKNKEDLAKSIVTSLLGGGGGGGANLSMKHKAEELPKAKAR